MSAGRRHGQQGKRMLALRHARKSWPQRSDGSCAALPAPAFDFAAEIAHLGAWEVDVVTERVTWSRSVFAIFDMPSDASLALDALFALVQPDARPRIEQLYRQCARDGTGYDVVVPVLTVRQRRIWVRVVGAGVVDDAGHVVTVRGALQDVTGERTQAAMSARLATRLADTLDAIGEAFFTLDTAFRFSFVNKAAIDLLKKSRADLVGNNIWELYPDAVGGISYQAYRQAMEDKVSASFDEFYGPLGRWFSARCYPFEDGIAVCFRDTTVERQREVELKKANRALGLLELANDALLRSTTEHELIERLLAVLPASGSNASAFVAYSDRPFGAHDEDGAAPRITIAGGRAADGLADALDTLGDEARHALRAGQTVHAALQLHGAATAAILIPLKIDWAPHAMLIVCPGQGVQLDRHDLKVLNDVAGKVAFGIATLRSREEQRQFQQALVQVAQSVSNTGGAGFFEQLVRAMVAAVGADAGFLALPMDAAPGRARTLVGVVDGELVTPFEYELHDAPCAAALSENRCVVRQNAAADYPHSPAGRIGAHGYAGWRLGSASTATGVLFVLFRRKLPASDFVNSAVHIFANRAAAELARLEQEHRLREQAAILDSAQDGIIVRANDNRIVFWSKGAERLYGWSKEEALGRFTYDLLGDRHDEYQRAKRITLESGFWEGEVARRRKDGTETNVELRLSLMLDDGGSVQGMLSISTDINRRKLAEREVEKLAFYDPLTGLPNRALLLDRIGHAVEATARRQLGGALFLIDIDDFKNLNDTMGHDTGDALLAVVGARLRESLYRTDTLARFGGDEFMVLIDDLSLVRSEAVSQAASICRKLRELFAAPVHFGGVVRRVTVSIGVAFFGDTQADVGELLKQAELAMFDVKAAGRDGVRFFDPAMQVEASRRAQITHDMLAAFDQAQFTVFYQPQLNHEGTIIGAEALLRWFHPVRGTVSPMTFIPMAEESGMILRLGSWVLRTVCQQAARWSARTGFDGLTISVNVSVRQMRDPAFVDDILAIVQETGVAPRRLKLEITESLLMDDVDATIATIERIRALGIGFSLDDFGTGFSSLSYLKQLPLDELKIDRAFVTDITHDRHAAAIAQSILELGRLLELDVMVEGIETQEQKDLLLALGCKGFQGYYFSRPVALEQFEQFVHAHAPAPRASAG